MSSFDHQPSDAPRPQDPTFSREAHYDDQSGVTPPRFGRRQRIALWVVFAAFIVAVGGYFYARHWIRSGTRAALPQLDGSLAIPALAAPVTILRDAQGVPHIRAASLDDMLVAQGFVTAQDRLFQMDLLRRHAAGELAEVLGPSALSHDSLQRTLQIRAAADRALAILTPQQAHVLERYAAGVNASINVQRKHLPIEFGILRYQPAPWTPRDSLLVSLAIFEDLTNHFPVKLARESMTARLPSELVQDLYPVGSWRDHPPAAAVPDLTVPGPPIEDIPLDESQASLRQPDQIRRAVAAILSHDGSNPDACTSCTAGSNNWVVSGAHTASGKPLLSNDMHLNHTLPGVWYEADLEASGPGTTFHVAGVSLPGYPLILVGHNEHIAWGITNLGADVQDLYLETTRGSGAELEFQATDGSWQAVTHLQEPIHVHGAKDVAFEVLATRHGDTLTPILSPETVKLGGTPRTIALRWTLYDPHAILIPSLEVSSAHDWPSFLAALEHGGGPAQNIVYADDQGHIGFHTTGFVPMRGPAQNQASSDAASLPADIATPVESRTAETPIIAAAPNPLTGTDLQAPAAPTMPQLSGPLSAVPLVPSAAHEWTGYIPFDQLPQAYDPPGGVIATANARTAPDDYKYPITLDWGGPYRNDRLWHVLEHATKLTPASMLAIQNDVYSDFDHVLAQRLAYAIDETLLHPGAGPPSPAQKKTLQQAADLLRSFNGRMTLDSSAAPIVSAVHTLLWPMLLEGHLAPAGKPRTPAATPDDNFDTLYVWGGRDYALEQVLMHTPTRWLPAGYGGWNDFLTAAVLRGLTETHAPADLSTWHYGALHTVDIEHPFFAQSPALGNLLGLRTGTGAQPQSGDGTTVKQVGHTFGPSERFTADLANLDQSTLNIVLGQSGNPASPWFLNQFPAWLHGSTYTLPFTDAAATAAATHTLTLHP